MKITAPNPDRYLFIYTMLLVRKPKKGPSVSCPSQMVNMFTYSLPVVKVAPIDFR